MPVRLPKHQVQIPSQHWGWSFINRLSYISSTPGRGDVVAIRMAGESVVHVRRIVGLPGEEILILRGKVYINGQELEEPYVVAARPWNLSDIKLAQDEYFVIGDFRNTMIEDHLLGKVNRERIIGKVLF